MVLDIHELTVVTDLFVICSGDNERLLRAISRDVLEAADKAGIDPRDASIVYDQPHQMNSGFKAYNGIAYDKAALCVGPKA